MDEIESRQRSFCKQHSAQFVPAPETAMTGFALSTRNQIPLNGLRNIPVGQMSGWYLWCGENFSEAPDFFSPLHTSHLYEDYPEIIDLLGLPPGYRFLLAPDYLDVWFDENLLVT